MPQPTISNTISEEKQNPMQENGCFFIYTVLQMFTQFDLFIMENAYVPVGGNERGRGATPTPTSILIFDSYDIKTLWYEFGHDIFTGFKMPRL